MKKQNIAMAADTSSVDVDVAIYTALPRHDYMYMYAATGNRISIQFSGVDFGAYKYVAQLWGRLARDLH